MSNVCSKCPNIDPTILSSEWHESPKRIGIDFELVRVESENGDYAMKLNRNDKSIFVRASQEEIALWRSREGLYAVLGQIYKAAIEISIEDEDAVDQIKYLLRNSNLDMKKILGENHGAS